MKYFITAHGLATFLALTTVAGPAIPADLQERENAARQATGIFLKKLGEAFNRELGSGGPIAAIGVCTVAAPMAAGELSIQYGWRITRVSSKPRNPMLALPDAWESSTLTGFVKRAASGEQYPDMFASEIVTENGQSYYRYMQPLTIQPLCLTCHGTDTDIPPDVLNRLNRDYPHDKARNYRLGELRGAVSVKQPLDIPVPDSPPE